MSYRIVLDSSADAVSWAAPTEEISSVPLRIITDARQFVDDWRLDVGNMVDYLASLHEKSGTACPNVGEWKHALSGSDMAFAITITSKLSGSYNAACLAKEAIERENAQAQIHVIDSRMTGPAMRLIAEKIEQLANAGLPFASICQKIDEYRDRSHLVFALESLRNLANNGRVHPAAAKLAGVLGIRVVGRATDGELDPFAKCKGERKVIKTIFEEMKSKGYDGGKVRISHVFNENAARIMSDLIKREFPQADVLWCQARGLVSFYAERNGLLVGYEGK
ncbi:MULTISPECIES: DegV family protein [unclassified Adlercreutzia]|uniref:DegV family protein n=1 Tax=unclassified Adlercreutzia TaxID=2636013 RepID=UPI0013EBC356|nr:MULTISPECIES: DegV family protein [unclassified Adlercreutzia]